MLERGELVDEEEEEKSDEARLVKSIHSAGVCIVLVELSK